MKCVLVDRLIRYSALMSRGPRLAPIETSKYTTLDRIESELISPGPTTWITGLGFSMDEEWHSQGPR
jgi:hypothetical protein